MRLYYLSALLLLCIFTIPGATQAQSLVSTDAEEGPSLDLLLTWQTSTNVPHWFSGKILPIRGSTVKILLTALNNGAAFDLSGFDVSWNINRRLIEKGDNLTTLEYTIGEFSPPELELDVIITQGRSKRIARTYLTIPVTEPRVVISVPYANNFVPQEDMTLQAVPFFFDNALANILSFAWSINNSVVPLENTIGGVVAASFDSRGSNIPVSVTITAPGKLPQPLRAITHVDIR